MQESRYINPRVREQEATGIGDLSALGTLGLTEGSLYAPNIQFRVPFAPPLPGDNVEPTPDALTLLGQAYARQ